MVCDSFAGEPMPLTAEEQATRDALQAEMDGLEATYAEADELPEEVDQRLGEIETALAAFDDRPVAFDPEDDQPRRRLRQHRRRGRPAVERGYVRPEDELPIEPDAEAGGEQARREQPPLALSTTARRCRQSPSRQASRRRTRA